MFVIKSRIQQEFCNRTYISLIVTFNWIVCEYDLNCIFFIKKSNQCYRLTFELQYKVLPTHNMDM